jgi:hypothetical protein
MHTTVSDASPTTAIEFLNRQNEEISDLIQKHRTQLKIIKSWTVKPPNTERILEDNLSAMLDQQNKIQKGLSMLTGEDSYKDQYLALMEVNSESLEMMH